MGQEHTSTGNGRLLEHLISALSESLSSMTGQTFTVMPGSSGAEDLNEPIVWQQTFSAGPEPGVWLAVGRDLWEAAGSMVLAAVGIDSASEEDCRSTWLEIAGQTMGGLAMRVTGDVQQEVSSARGEDIGAMPEISTTFLTASSGEVSWQLGVAWSAVLAALYEPRAAPAAGTSDVAFSKTFDLLLDVALPVSISFGKTVLPIREVLKLNTGSIVELNRLVTEPVDVIVNDCVIARGEVVVVEGNYGVRVTHLASREDRLRTGMDGSVKTTGAGR
jgi:flagellar motor switch protein FliN/FliY